jgi:decaprenylphospho-beta-D-ribofuranose 2-oxidase
MAWRPLALRGWGRIGRSDALVARPERIREVLGAMADCAGQRVIARGAGRSYGDAAQNGDGRVVLTTRLDRLLAFDEAEGLLVAEPGVTFADLLDTFLPRGFLAPVTPGTAFATLGGGVAADVHGKNHESAGSLGRHLRWLDLLLPSGEVVRTSPSERPDLFAATVGGMGLTGIVLALCLRLQRVPSNAVALREERIGGLDDFLDRLSTAGPATTFSVGWIDALATGSALGRGILELAEPAAQSLEIRPPRQRTVPIDLPGLALSSWSVRAFNEIYWRRVPRAGRTRTVGLGRFLYPLDAVRGWNRIYGRRGFRQLQCVVPRTEGPAALRRLLETTARTGRTSFLAVLKAMGETGFGHLSFPMPGYTLALDLPERPGTLELMRELETITLDHGGRIYLAKDSCLTPEGFFRMYPRLGEFRRVLEEVDPEARLSSDLARRLRIREAGHGR